jgi:copper chaperone CopZ
MDGGDTMPLHNGSKKGMPLFGSRISDKEYSMPYYVHEVPGRLRIKIPTLKRNVHEARKLETLLGTMEGVFAVSVNHMTGSMLINYDTSILCSSEIFALLSRGGYIEVEKVTPSVKKIDKDLKKLGRLASKALVGIVLDRALEGSPLSILTAFI